MDDFYLLPAFHRRPLGIGQILDGSFNLFRRHLTLMLGMVFIAYFLAYAVSAIFEIVSDNAWLRSMQLLNSADSSNMDETMRIIAGLLLPALPLIIVGFLLSYCLQIIGTGLIVVAANNIYRHAAPGSWRQNASEIMPILPRLVLTVLLKDFLVFLPIALPLTMIAAAAITGNAAVLTIAGCFGILLFLAAICVSLFLNLMFSLTPVVVISENRSYMDAIKRSWQLLRLKDEWASPKSHMYRMAIIMSLFFVLGLALGMVVAFLPLLVNPSQFLEMFRGGTQMELNPWVRFLTGMAALSVSALVAAPMWLAYVILYFDIRMRHEGYDLQPAAGAAGAGAGPGLPMPAPLPPPAPQQPPGDDNPYRLS